MEGFVTVQCKVKMEDNKGESPVVAVALIPNPEGPYSKNGYGTIKASPKHKVPFSKLRYVCAQKNMLSALDEREGAVFTRCPATYFKVLNPDGTYSYRVRASFGTKDMPLERTFRINKIDGKYLESFKSQYEFTLVEYDNDEEADAADSDTDDND